MIPRIVVLPENGLEILGASFDLTNAVLIFGNDKPWEEQLTVLHEIAHILDPGWQDQALKVALRQDLERAPKASRLLLNRVETGAHEGFAELSAWELAGLKELAHFPRSREIVHAALYWEN